VYSNIIINNNGLDIIIALNSVYFEYVKNLCKIFVKCIMQILKIYPNHFIIFLKMVTNENLNYFY
jgi:hypothetical protein